MCGIAGWVNIDPQRPVDQNLLQKMNRALAHRGPDDEGYLIDGNVGLAQRRLSIIDTSSMGRQPIFNEDGTIAVILNGEIYNYLELKAILLQDGHRFVTNTDTEVLVHAFEKWGIDFINKLDGMFSLALFDRKNFRLILARDPFGKKPLYYSLQKGLLLFGSEIKALAAHPDFESRMDPESISSYFALDYVPTPKTIFQNCWKLRQGSFLDINTKAVELPFRPKTYWRLHYEPKLKISEPEAVDGFRDLFGKAVSKRLMSDVPLGVFLSGGIDSSLVVAFMAKAVGKVETFTIGFSENSYDESKVAKSVAEYFGTEHFEKKLDPDSVYGVLPQVVARLDEPFADPSVLPTYILSQFARQKVTVALGGDGGDEHLAGYDPFLAHRLFGKLAWVPFPLYALGSKIAALIPTSEKNMSLNFKLQRFLQGLKQYSTKSPVIRNALWMAPFTPELQKHLFTRSINLDLGWENVFSELLEHAERCDAKNDIDGVIDSFIQMYLHDDILVKVDRTSMMNSLEVRTPFLDKSLSEFLARLPVRMKMRGGKRKYLLKKASTGILPNEIIDRKKKGFGIPVAGWLKGPLRSLLEESLCPEQINKLGLFDSQYVEALVRDHLKGAADHRKELWALLIFENWREAHNINSI